METYNLPNNRKLNIVHDTNAETPREWDNITKMIFFGKHSHLGDENEFSAECGNDWVDQEDIIRKHYGRDLVHIQKVYGYSHSGLTIALTPFSCPWDSGTLGFVIVTRQDIRTCFGGNATKAKIEQAISQVNGEIETLDQYIRGDMYGLK